MKKNNILLISLYDPDSLGIRSLHAVLNRENFNVSSVFFKYPRVNNTMGRPSEKEIDLLLNHVAETKPDLIGISVRSTFYQLAREITERIREKSEAMIVWGGIHPSVRPAQCVRYADAVCIGEGERAMLELAMKQKEDEDVFSIQNLWFRNKGAVVRNEIGPLIEDLDSLPHPDFSPDNKFVIENDWMAPFPADRLGYTIMTSRGCFFACTYCCNQALREIFKGKGRYVRRRSVQNVIDELIEARKRFGNLRIIYFYDDVFTFDLDWIREFSRLYREHIALPFFCYFHPAFLNDEIARILKEAGVEFMTTGIQSGSERITHNYFNRPVSNDDIVKSAKILKKYDIDCGFDLILDNPLENEEDRISTLSLLLKIPRPFEVYHVTLTHFPESKLTRLLLEMGMIHESDVEDVRQKGYDRWSLILDLARDDENLFWENLYFLANKKYVPKELIRFLSKIKLLKRHPRPLTRLLRRASPYLATGTRSPFFLDLTKYQLQE